MKPFIKPRSKSAPPSPAPASNPRISPNELTIFGVAASLADPEERAAYLDRACGTDAEFRARLEERLETRDRQNTSMNAAVTVGSAELARPVRENALATKDRPDAVALVPMSAMQLAASQQPPRHSPIPWTAATILAIAVGALAVFFFMERKTREQAQQETELAQHDRAGAEREREAAAAAALEAKTIADRAEQARQAALREKEAVAADAVKARAEAAQNRTEREQAVSNLKSATDKAQAAEAALAKLRVESAAAKRATDLALADSIARLGAAQMDTRAYGDAEASLRQSLQARVALGADPWTIVENRALLGSVLMQRNQDAAALEQIATAAAAIEAMGVPAEGDRARAAAVSKRIVQFFTVTGRRKEAGEWRRRLETILAAR